MSDQYHRYSWNGYVTTTRVPVPHTDAGRRLLADLANSKLDPADWLHRAAHIADVEAAERRATVERIRERFDLHPPIGSVARTFIADILDEEAAR